MFELIRQLIGYSGQMNIDNSIVQICQVLIPVFSVTVIWFFAHLVAFITGICKK